ncbi:MAG: energy-coupling factor transporter transmembrane component T [Desulfobacterales bacterium]|jgi:energy-coupling factor transporter transmembrane protein EcfT
MAQLTTFSFQPGTSVLHKLDVRFKILFLILISFISLGGGLMGLGTLSMLISVLILHSRLPLKSGLREFRFFFILLLLILMARMLTTPGVPLIEFKSIAITRPGLVSGIRICWRLVIIALLGFLFVFSTRSSEIKAAVEWFLKPFGFLPVQHIATMLGLIVRFIPVILNQAKETAEAQRARCLDNRKNPLDRLVRLGFPLIRRTFEQADRLIVAMEARCYSENRTEPALCATRKDWMALFILIVISGWVLFISVLL